ncbi:MAG: ABC transporter ATP-binding protein, partial [Sphingobium sp.]
AGLEPKMQGEVTIGGDAIARLPAIARARRIGFLPQRGEVHWNLSARTLVALGRLACGNPDHDEEVVDGVMADLDIAHFADRPVLTLSGGELARVLLGRVLAGEPQWLLADEPLANLDPAHQVAVLDRLSAVARAGAGVVAVLHDVNHAARMAGHVLLMKEGEILAEGLPEAALTPERLEQAFGVPFRRMMDESLILFPA